MCAWKGVLCVCEEQGKGGLCVCGIMEAGCTVCHCLTSIPLCFKAFIIRSKHFFNLHCTMQSTGGCDQLEGDHTT